MRSTRSHQKRPVGNQKSHLKNEDIRIPFLSVITPSGEKHDNMATSSALAMAQDLDLDLVLMSMDPPVAKIMDYGKFRYEQTKKEQQSKKGQKIAETKEIRLRPKTDSHDVEIKMKKIREFLEKGHKVKLTMMFRGREAMYVNKGRENINILVQSVADISQVEGTPVYMGKRLSAILAPTKK